jgi:hypothetical protein
MKYVAIDAIMLLSAFCAILFFPNIHPVVSTIFEKDLLCL